MLLVIWRAVRIHLAAAIVVGGVTGNIKIAYQASDAEKQRYTSGKHSYRKIGIDKEKQQQSRTNGYKSDA